MKQSHIEAGEQKTYVFAADQPALILFSGGTSGKAKGVLLSNSNMNALAKEVISQVTPDPNSDSMLCILPFFHGFGLGISLHPVLLAGGCCILIPRFSPQEFATAIIKKKPTYIAGVPTLFEGFLRNKKIQKMNLSFLKDAFCGGDVTPPTLVRRFNSFVKLHGGTATLREGYGLTECVTACSLMPVSSYKEGSVGLPFSTIEIKTVNPETLEEKAPGCSGEICIKGPTVMLGYHQQAEESAQALRVHKDGTLWLHTGDLGYLDEDGFLFFQQRLKRIIKSSGYTVYPTQVEVVLNSHPMVEESCVIGVPCPYKIQKLKAFIVLRQTVSSEKEMATEIKNYVTQNLIKWSVPAEIEFCASLPRTKVGKIAHLVLERQEKEKSQAG
ncbi:MAG: AMP-binding protein [Firmicutes bacterium]|nr:AMP-binding protein [Bacillota bacterium]